MVQNLSGKKRFSIGMRNLKSGFSVLLCLLLYKLIGRDGYFLACTSAIICMQGSLQKSLNSGRNRLIGTGLGALFGTLVLYSNLLIQSVDLTLFVAPVGVVLFIAICNTLNKPDAIVIGCVVFLIIVLQQTDQSPIVYGLNRFVDTLFGIAVAIAVNRLIPRPNCEQKPASGQSGSDEDKAHPGNNCSSLWPAPHEMKYFMQERNGIELYSNMMDVTTFVEQIDPEVGQAIRGELLRQRRNLELIASENIVSPAVMAAIGSVLTNKYAEGYPGKRYYGGCQNVDVVENIAIERAKKLFGAAYANVQPHSGAQANEAVYAALLQHGDTVLGMDLSQGGHLTHGSPVNFSGRNFKIIPYGVDPVTHRIDYDAVRQLALEHKPKMIIAGASAYPREIDFSKFSEIAKECGAYLFVDMAHIAGLVAAGLHMSPIPYADVVTTTTHKTLRGTRGGAIFTNSEELATKINKAVFPGTQGGPLMHVIAAKAVGFGEALSDEFKAYQKQIVANAAALANALMNRGFKLVSGGTDNHLMLLDLSGTDLTGKELERRLDEVYITVNKNTVPGETRSPFVTSGVRIGTPAVTTRGLKEADMEIIADCIARAAGDFESEMEGIRATVNELCNKYPLYE